MISVVIPTLNSAAHLPYALSPLVTGVAKGAVKQVVIADGGSTDETLEIAGAAGCDVVAAKPVRSRQLIAGAASARGDWLLFLHPETVLGGGWSDEASRFMARASARSRAAAFRFAFDDDERAARRVEYWVRWRCRHFGLPSGAQGLLISRRLYDIVGGYPPMDFMEDVEIVRRIGRRRLSMLETDASINAEKYRRDGYEKRAWAEFIRLARYMAGADPNVLLKGAD